MRDKFLKRKYIYSSLPYVYRGLKLHNIAKCALPLFFSVFLFIAIFSMYSSSIGKVYAVEEVRFIGEVYRGETVYSEQLGVKEYFIGVIITEVLEDPNDLIFASERVHVFYFNPMGLNIGDVVDVYGYYSFDGEHVVVIFKELNVQYYLKLIDHVEPGERKEGIAVVIDPEFVHEIKIQAEKVYEYETFVMEVLETEEEKIKYYHFRYPEKLDLKTGDVVRYRGVVRNVTVEESIIEGEVEFFDDKSFIEIISSRITIKKVPLFVIPGSKIKIKITVENSPKGSLYLSGTPFKSTLESASNISTFDFDLTPTPIPITGDGDYSIEIVAELPPGKYELSAFILPEGWTLENTELIMYEGFFRGAKLYECHNIVEDSTFYVSSIPKNLTVLGVLRYEKVYREPPPVREAGLLIVGSFTLSCFLAYIANFNTFSQLFGSIKGIVDSLMKSIKAPDWLQEAFSNYLEEYFKALREKKIPRPKRWRIVTLRELVTVIFSIIIMVIVYTFIESGTLSNFLTPSIFTYIAPRVLLTTVLIYLVSDYGESLIAKFRNIWAEIRLWPSGSLSLLLTGFLLRSPFASPSLTLYQYGCPWWEKVRITILKFLLLIFLTGFFALAYMLGFRILGDTGILICLISASFMLIPVKPYPGRELMKKKPMLWFLLFILAFTLYFTAFSNLIPCLAYIAIGFLSFLVLFYEQVFSKKTFILRFIKAPIPPPP